MAMYFLLTHILQRHFCTQNDNTECKYIVHEDVFLPFCTSASTCCTCNVQETRFVYKINSACYEIERFYEFLRNLNRIEVEVNEFKIRLHAKKYFISQIAKETFIFDVHNRFKNTFKEYSSGYGPEGRNTRWLYAEIIHKNEFILFQMKLTKKIFNELFQKINEFQRLLTLEKNRKWKNFTTYNKIIPGFSLWEEIIDYWKYTREKIEKESIFAIVKNEQNKFTEKKANWIFNKLKETYTIIKEKYFTFGEPLKNFSETTKLEEYFYQQKNGYNFYDLYCKRIMFSELKRKHAGLVNVHTRNTPILMTPENINDYEIFKTEYLFKNMPEIYAKKFKPKCKIIPYFAHFLENCSELQESKKYTKLINEHKTILNKKRKDFLQRESILKKKVIEFNNKLVETAEKEKTDLDLYEKEMRSFYGEYKEFVEEYFEILYEKQELWYFASINEIYYKFYKRGLFSIIKMISPQEVETSENQFNLAEKSFTAFILKNKEDYKESIASYSIEFRKVQLTLYLPEKIVE